MTTKKILSVKEFAEKAGVTTQAVYKRMNKDLSTFQVQVDGKKCLMKEGLRLFDIEATTTSENKQLIKNKAQLDKTEESTENSNPDILSVKEFAEKAGVTVQAVYQRMNKDLSTFQVQVDGKKCLMKEGLRLFNIESSVEVYKQQLLKNKGQIETLEKEIDQLRREIFHLQEDIEKADKRETKLFETLFEQAKDISRAQQLQAATMAELQEQREIVRQLQHPEPEPQEAPEKTRRGLFHRKRSKRK